jgi:uncharacterized protein YciI
MPCVGPAKADDAPKRESVPSKDAEKASEGRLQKKLFVVTSTATKGFKPLKENLKDHLAYLGKLEREGKLFMAGPLFDTDPDRWSGDGLLVYNVKDHAEAMAVAESDPLHKSGARSFTIRPWLVNDGAMTFSIRLSDQTIKLP